MFVGENCRAGCELTTKKKKVVAGPVSIRSHYYSYNNIAAAASVQARAVLLRHRQSPVVRLCIFPLLSAPTAPTTTSTLRGRQCQDNDGNNDDWTAAKTTTTTIRRDETKKKKNYSFITAAAATCVPII